MKKYDFLSDTLSFPFYVRLYSFCDTEAFLIFIIGIKKSQYSFKNEFGTLVTRKALYIERIYYLNDGVKISISLKKATKWCFHNTYGKKSKRLQKNFIFSVFHSFSTTILFKLNSLLVLFAKRILFNIINAKRAATITRYGSNLFSFHICVTYAATHSGFSLDILFLALLVLVMYVMSPDCRYATIWVYGSYRLPLKHL